MFPRTRDGRGRRVRLHWRCLAATGDPARVRSGWGAAWGSARRVAASLLALPLLLALVGVVVVALVAFAAVKMGPVVIALVLFSPVAATGIMFIATSLATITDWYGRRSSAFQARMLAEGRCPSCDYGINGVEPQSDGCAVCPECAAAWMVGSPRRTPGKKVVVTMARPDAPWMPGQATDFPSSA